MPTNISHTIPPSMNMEDGTTNSNNIKLLSSKNLSHFIVILVAMITMILKVVIGGDFPHYTDMRPQLYSQNNNAAAVGFLIATVPLIIDSILDLGQSIMTNTFKIFMLGRLCIAISCLLGSIQLVTIEDNPNYFFITQNPTVSYALTIFCLRVTTIGSIMFTLNCLKSDIFTFQSTIIIHFLSALFSVFRFCAIGNNTLNQISSISAIIYIIILVYTLIRWIIKTIYAFPTLQTDEYSCVLYLLIFTIVMILGYGPVLLTWFNSDYIITDITTSKGYELILITSVFTFLCILLTVLPCRIAKHEAVVNMKNIIKVKTEYVRFISHELRTPLNTVFLGLSLSINQIPENTNNEEEKERRETLTEIASACSAALDILNELLFYDKLEHGILVLNKSKIKVKELIYEAIKMFTVQIREKKIDLKLFNNLNNSGGGHSGDEEGGGEGSSASSFISNSPTNRLNSDQNDTNITLDVHGIQSGIFSFDDYMAHNIDPVQVLSRVDSFQSQVLESHMIFDDDYLLIDKNKMTQVIRNVISNAIKFTPSGGKIYISIKFIPSDIPEKLKENKSFYSLKDIARRPLSVGLIRQQRTLSSISENFEGDMNWSSFTRRRSLSSVYPDLPPPTTLAGHIVIEVTDTGAGISEEDQQKLFKQIVQFKPEILQSGGGSGLGMWISKGIVDLHGGVISVKSRGEGQGSTFTIKIPMERELDAIEHSSPLPSPLCIYMSTSTKSNLSASHTYVHPTATIAATSNSSTNLENMLYTPTTDRSRLLPSFIQGNELTMQDRLNHSHENSVNSSLKTSQSIHVHTNANANTSTNTNNSINNHIYNNYDVPHPSMNLNGIVEHSTLQVESVESEEDSNRIDKGINKENRIDHHHHHTKENRIDDKHNNKIESKIEEKEAENQALYQARRDSSIRKSSLSLKLPPLNINILPNYSSKVTINMQTYLVVDDSTMNRKMLCRYLKSKVRICDEANDGLEAIKMVEINMKKVQAFQSQRSINSSAMSDISDTDIISKKSSSKSLQELTPTITTTTNNNTTTTTTIDHIQNGHPINNTTTTNTATTNNNITTSNIVKFTSRINDAFKNKKNDTSATGRKGGGGSVEEVQPYLAIFMDFVMPNMDGPTATAEIRKLGYTGPIIGVTGNAQQFDIDHYMAMGANDVLIKPVDSNQLLVILKKFNLMPQPNG